MSWKHLHQAARSAAEEVTVLVPWLFLVLAMAGQFDPTAHPKAGAVVAATWMGGVCSLASARLLACWWRSRG